MDMMEMFVILDGNFQTSKTNYNIIMTDVMLVLKKVLFL